MYISFYLTLNSIHNTASNCRLCIKSQFGSLTFTAYKRQRIRKTVKSFQSDRRTWRDIPPYIFAGRSNKIICNTSSDIHYKQIVSLML